MQIKNFTPRLYQQNILETCKNNNTLVCIPTGLGKTKIAILLTIEQLNKYPNTKAVVITPTKPLANQICNEFKECTTIDESKIILLTGATNPKKRQELYEESLVVVATPQTIQEDIENNRIEIGDYSLLVIDEAHRSRERFANTIVAKEYVKRAKYQKILALTASPGSTKSKIDEVCENLKIQAVEIRSEQDEDISQFVQSKEIEYINVDLPEELKTIHKLIKETYKEKLESLKSFNIKKPLSHITKKDLLSMQVYFQRGIGSNNAAFYGLSLIAQLLKLNHAMEMLETQGLSSLQYFLKKLETEETKAAKNITKDPNIIKARELSEEVIKKIDHPKINKLKEIIKYTIENKKDSKIIIFTTYRNTVENIVKTLNSIGIKTTRLVGQKEGLTQKEQIEIIKEFNSGKYSCLVTTSIGEEGIHIGEADAAIFYDNTPSSIRKIQRSGRVGRLKPGKVIFMITKGTRDAAYYWKSKRDESRMKGILYRMKNKKIEQTKQRALTQF